VWKHLGVVNAVQHFVDGYGEERNLVNDIFKAEHVTLCLVDGDHWGDRPEKDIALFLNCRYILVHDVAAIFPDVISAVDSMIKKGWKAERKGQFALLEKP
jgi:hypothetical protein